MVEVMCPVCDGYGQVQPDIRQPKCAACKGTGWMVEIERNIKTMAQIIDVPDDPVVEEVRRLFSSGSGCVEQANAQRRPLSPVEIRRMEWMIAQEIVAAVDRIRAELAKKGEMQG